MNCKETEEESNYLSQIPKIFVLDMCRGSMSAKPVQIGKKKTETRENKNVSQEKEESKDIQEKEKENKDDYEDKDTTIQEQATALSTQKRHKTAITNAKNEKLTFKGVSKDVASQLAGQASNFFKIYATPEGYAVADGSLYGGLFLRNFCKVFKDGNFISNHYWNEIVLNTGRFR